MRDSGPVPLPRRGEGGSGLAISADAKLVATGGGDHRAHVFDVRSRREVGATMRAAAPGRQRRVQSRGRGSPPPPDVGDPTPVPTDQSLQLWGFATRRPLAVSLGGTRSP